LPNQVHRNRRLKPAAHPPPIRKSARVESALLGNARVDTFPIEVDVHERVVTLRGSVSSPAARQLAVDLARQVFGVRNVVDRLAVKPSREIFDQMIRERVLTLLGQDPRLETATVVVNVSSGEARLSGEVASPAQKQLAEQLALRVPGVVKIRNDLAIRK
jgi:osmotically-inducible protein OsmY